MSDPLVLMASILVCTIGPLQAAAVKDNSALSDMHDCSDLESLTPFLTHT